MMICVILDRADLLLAVQICSDGRLHQATSSRLSSFLQLSLQHCTSKLASRMGQWPCEEPLDLAKVAARCNAYLSRHAEVAPDLRGKLLPLLALSLPVV